VTAAALAATSSMPTLQVPFASMTGGSPVSTVDTSKIVSMQWQLVATTGGDAGGCMSSFSVENVAFY
jgi:hypothetical protein